MGMSMPGSLVSALASPSDSIEGHTTVYRDYLAATGTVSWYCEELNTVETWADQSSKIGDRSSVTYL